MTTPQQNALGMSGPLSFEYQYCVLTHEYFIYNSLMFTKFKMITRLIRALLGPDDRILVYDYCTESTHGTWEAHMRVQ